MVRLAAVLTAALALHAAHAAVPTRDNSVAGTQGCERSASADSEVKTDPCAEAPAADRDKGNEARREERQARDDSDLETKETPERSSHDSGQDTEPK
jgi:hypothetical protein